MGTPTCQNVRVTKNYQLFERSHENRQVDLKKHRLLRQSMETNGFLACFPIVCYRNTGRKLVVKDGQHRLAFAEILMLPVYWTETSQDFDVAAVNTTPVKWIPRDFAEKHAANGLEVYQEGLEFSDAHRIPVGIAFSLLAGTTTFSNIRDSFADGTFSINDRAWADAVVGIYGPLVTMSPAIKNSRFLMACMGVCRVPSFDERRLIQGAGRCRDKLVAYSTRDAYLEMLEVIYNYGRKTLVGLKAEASMAMRDRCLAAIAPINAQHA